MFYYEVAIIGANLEPLTYSSAIKLASGQIASATLATRKTPVNVLVLKEVTKPSFKTKSLSLLDISFSALQLELMQFISTYYACNISLAAALFSPLLKASFNLGGCSAVYKNSPNYPLANLSSVQAKALNCTNLHASTLLFGDTGSGKTEIYIHAIAKALECGKQVLFLMPEISLTPQMCERISKHFNFACWHSKITKSAKQKVLSALESGDIKLILGARSALFLPWENLGLIIVDEEHDASYKSSRYPCINARDLALYVGAKSGAKVILGSATPSMASYYNANLAKFRLRGTYFEAKSKVEFLESGEILSDKLVDEIIYAHKDSRTSLIFLPVRANFRQVVCKDCGCVAMCPRCSVALSLHNKLYRCHYCNYKTPFKQQCSNCKSELLEGVKIGTAQLANELNEALESRGFKLNIARLDSDEASSPAKLKSILEDFASDKIDVLIGTQMIAKGHDYHNIGFCAILGLDNQLYYPEFAAREQTLALAIQVAGRAGRAKQAKVLFSTKHVEFFSKYLNDFDSFLEDEKALRCFYPPFKRLLRFIIESTNYDEASLLCDELAKSLLASRKSEDDYELVGYGPCAIEKINKSYRFNVLIRSEHKMLLSHLAAHYKSLPKVTIDIDPIHFS